jgi:hypothetical protein
MRWTDFLDGLLRLVCMQWGDLITVGDLVICCCMYCDMQSTAGSHAFVIHVFAEVCFYS